MLRVLAASSLLALAACSVALPPATRPVVAVCPPDPAPGSGYVCAPKPPPAACVWFNRVEPYLPAIKAIFIRDPTVFDDITKTLGDVCGPAKVGAALMREGIIYHAP